MDLIALNSVLNSLACLLAAVYFVFLLVNWSQSPNMSALPRISLSLALLVVLGFRYELYSKEILGYWPEVALYTEAFLYRYANKVDLFAIVTIAVFYLESFRSAYDKMLSPQELNVGIFRIIKWGAFSLFLTFLLYASDAVIMTGREFLICFLATWSALVSMFSIQNILLTNRMSIQNWRRWVSFDLRK